MSFTALLHQIAESVERTRSGGGRPRNLLTHEEIRAVRTEHARGVTRRTLQTKYHVSAKEISAALKEEE